MPADWWTLPPAGGRLFFGVSSGNMDAMVNH